MKGGLGSRVEVGTGTTASDLEGSRDKRFVPPTVDEIARFFPQLEVLEFIGQGGMGAVYKARQKQLDRVVALKILPPDIGEDAAFAERFTREAKAMARLSHPGIVTIHDFGQTDGLFYFLMEYVDGVTLWQLLSAGRVSPREALAIVPQICDALQYAHDAGIVHRDIKPENILLDRQGRVKVADFGLAKLVGIAAEPAAEGEAAPGPPAQTEAGRVMGTPQYMAPEQRERPQDVDHRADIYSLGVVFYQLLTGELPSRPIEPPSKRVQIDVRLDEVVLRALEKEPQRRYQQAGEIKTRVETIVTTPNAGAVGAAARPPDRRMVRTAIEEAQRQVKGPAIALLVAGLISVLTSPMVVLMWEMEGVPQSGVEREAVHSGAELVLPIVLFLAELLGSIALSTLIIVAAVKMKRLQAYRLAIAASILAIIILTPFCLIGLPIGIWALVVLSQREVRAAFAQNRKRATGSASASPPGERPSERPASRRPLPILAGILFLLPPAAFIWFLLAGHQTLGVDLDADVQFFVGLVGLPLSAGVGAVLAWAIEILRCSLGLASNETTPATPRRWCWQAILSVVLLVVSLPLGGTTIVVVHLMGLDAEGWMGWDPGTEELVVTLSLFGGAFLPAAVATLLGIEALRRIRRASERLRGRLGALAAAWFWPCMLVVLAISLPLAESAYEQEARAIHEQIREEIAQFERDAEAARAEKRARLLQYAGPASAAPSYEVTDLGALGGPTSVAHGVNAGGQVVGGADTASGTRHAFLHSNGKMTDLGTLAGPDGAFSEAFGINASGQVVGYADVGGNNRHAFLYSKSKMIDLGTLSGPASSSHAYHINSDGQVVGASAIRAFLYRNGEMFDLGTSGRPLHDKRTYLSSPEQLYTGSEAYGVNDRGQVVGCVRGPGSTALETRAFLYRSGKVTELGFLPGGSRSLACDINDSSQVVGYADTADGNTHAFLYADGKMIDLGTLGGAESWAKGINATAQVVGSAHTASGKRHAYLYSNGIMTDLNTRIDPAAGWKLEEATAINDSGWIVGRGKAPSENSRAFLLTPAVDVDSGDGEAGNGPAEASEQEAQPSAVE